MALKSSGLRWSQRIDDIMIELNFIPCKADPCVWLREKKTKYKYIAIYVDALLDHSQNYALHFICITFHLHYI